MLRQILVHVDDQHVQAIVWREGETEEIASYFLTTVTFEFACSPFLASRTLKQLEKARLKQEQIINLLDSGGFKLRKWLTKNSSLVDWLPYDILAIEANLKVVIGYAVLGVAWDPDQDYFYFDLSLESLDDPIAKRTVRTFVANRYADIATVMPEAHWHYINSSDNPANLASRGYAADELIGQDLWWLGPKRIRESNSE